MLRRILLILVAVLAAVLAAGAQNSPHVRDLDVSPEEPRLPNGKFQREEILKAEYKKSLEDARELSRLADELKVDLEKNDYNVLSLATLKKVDDIDKLARHIHDRLKHF
jgi:hypothetical protein